ncbi:MAG: hypothetical protein Q9195_007727, partial [Heterodermia aff. obscurata]
MDFILILLLQVLDLVLAYPPACNEYYGRPNYNHCLLLLRGSTHPTTGIANLDRQSHFFGISGIERPPEIATYQFRHKVDIPKFWSNILYAPDSTFERDTLAKYKAGTPIGVPDPAGIPEYKTPQYRRKRPRPGGGSSEATADSAGSVAVKPRVQGLGNLGSGWYMKYDSVTDILPPVDAAGALTDFYNTVTANAADNLGSGKSSAENLAFQKGSFSLQLSSQSPILWSWVVNFAQSMIESMGPDFTSIFRGEAVSGYWVLDSVQVA